jgi:tetratricopeptide (TPR) repeat protein
MFALLLIAFVLSVLFRGGISTWLWPDSRSEELQTQANAALQAGLLTQSDGNGARELFEAALAVKPDQVQAREGLVRVALAALDRAEHDVEQGRYPAAHVDLQLAQALEAPREKVDQVVASLREHETRIDSINKLLVRAASARVAGRLDQDEASALPLYQRVLALQPRNQHAVEGREDALIDLLLPAQAALDAGDAQAVADLLRRAQRFDPGHVELPALQAGFARLLAERVQQLHTLIAKRSFERAAALCIEFRALQEAGGMPAACNNQVVAGLATHATRLAEDFDFAASEQLLASAGALVADDPRVLEAQHHLADACRGASKLPTIHHPNRRNLAKVQALLADAAKAQIRGDWITPPGESAWDKLLAARALAPGDARVRRALASLLPSARKCQAESLRDNRLRESQACLDVWRQLAPLDHDLVKGRTRLAQRWIAVGHQRLERGEIAGAGQAAEQARRLDPRTDGLDEFEQRLRRAQPGKP